MRDVAAELHAIAQIVGPAAEDDAVEGSGAWSYPTSGGWMPAQHAGLAEGTPGAFAGALPGTLPALGGTDAARDASTPFADDETVRLDVGDAPTIPVAPVRLAAERVADTAETAGVRTMPRKTSVVPTRAIVAAIAVTLIVALVAIVVVVIVATR